MPRPLTTYCPSFREKTYCSKILSKLLLSFKLDRLVALFVDVLPSWIWSGPNLSLTPPYFFPALLLGWLKISMLIG